MKTSSTLLVVLLIAVGNLAQPRQLRGDAPASVSREQTSSQESSKAETPPADSPSYNAADTSIGASPIWSPYEQSDNSLCSRAPCSVGFTGGAELLFLRPYFADGFAQSNIFSFGAAPRFWLGYKLPSDLEIRTRYWDFDNNGGNDATATYRLDTSIFDLELLDTIPLGHQWDITVSGGWRYVDFRFLNGEAPNTEMSVVSSNGLTASIELHRRLQRGFSLYGGFRASWLFGNLSYEAPWLQPRRQDWHDATQTMTETQFGLEWAKSLEHMPCEFMARAGVEAQWWNSFATNMDASQIGFFGYSLSIGIRR